MPDRGRRRVWEASPDIDWPPGLAPAEADAFAHDEVAIDAPPSVVWRYLVEAANWPSWYPSAQRVRFSTASAKVLDQDAEFAFDTCGTRIDAVVAEFVPYSRLAWLGTQIAIGTYHVWLLLRLPDGCHVITEEVANVSGPVPIREPDSEVMHRAHVAWLDALRRVAEL